MLRLAGLVGLWLFCLVMALAGGWAIMWNVVYALGLLLVSSLAWAHLNVAGLELRRRRAAGRVQVGDSFTEHAILEPRKGLLGWWPRLWLEVRDGSDLPGHALDRVLSVGPRGRTAWELTSRCVMRGRFTLGPVWVTSGDPFGLFKASRQIGGESRLIVYPRTEDLPRFGRVPGHLPGGSVQGARVQFSTPSVASIREYAPGDPFNRIHWRTTARAGRLMVREFELDPSADIWVVLDLDADVQAGTGLESTEEYAVSAAASLAHHFLEQGRAVGLISQSATLPPDRGTRQAERMIEILALVRANQRLTLEGMLMAETARFTRTSTLVLVTPSTREGWVHVCQALGGRGVQSLALLVEAATFGKAPPSLLLVSTLAAARLPVHVLKAGQRLAQVLASSALVARS